MKYFNSHYVEELKDYLYHGHGHDATIVKIEYLLKDEYNKDKLIIDTYNTYDKVRVGYVFREIQTMVFCKGSVCGEKDIILGITIEDDMSYFKSRFNSNEISLDGCLYLVLQMKTFDEIHIICREMYINEED